MLCTANWEKTRAYMAYAGKNFIAIYDNAILIMLEIIKLFTYGSILNNGFPIFVTI